MPTYAAAFGNRVGYPSTFEVKTVDFTRAVDSPDTRFPQAARIRLYRPGFLFS